MGPQIKWVWRRHGFRESYFGLGPWGTLGACSCSTCYAEGLNCVDPAGEQIGWRLCRSHFSELWWLVYGVVSRLGLWATPGLGGEASHHGSLWPWPAAGEGRGGEFCQSGGCVCDILGCSCWWVMFPSAFISCFYSVGAQKLLTVEHALHLLKNLKKKWR